MSACPAWAEKCNSENFQQISKAKTEQSFGKRKPTGPKTPAPVSEGHGSNAAARQTHVGSLIRKQPPNTSQCAIQQCKQWDAPFIPTHAALATVSNIRACTPCPSCISSWPSKGCCSHSLSAFKKAAALLITVKCRGPGCLFLSGSNSKSHSDTFDSSKKGYKASQ